MTVVSCPLEQICVPVESSSPLVVSNQKEVLRCFTVLGKQAAASHAGPSWTRRLLARGPLVCRVAALLRGWS